MMRFLRKATENAIVVLFSVLIVVVFLQVVARYIFNNPPSWTEELARYCQVWIIILASTICIRKGSHLAVDYFSHHFSPKFKQRLQGVLHVLMAIYLLVVTIYGFRLMWVGQYQVSPAMQISMSIVYLIFPLGGLLMTIEAAIKAKKLLC